MTEKLFTGFTTILLLAASLYGQDIKVDIKADSGTYTDKDYPAKFVEMPEVQHKASVDAIKEWQDQRFGMFIHWGVYSVLGGKWKGEEIPHLGEQIQNVAGISGKDYIEHAASKFNPVKFDAGEYARLAKAAGMRYIILTSKHHDGFCMFDSKHTDYDIMDATPYKKDIVKMFADGCKAEGIKFGVYYSNPDWHHGHELSEDGFSVNERLRTDSANYKLEQNQLKELLSNYGPMLEIFFDMGSLELELSAALAKTVRTLQPNCLVSGRVMNHQGDFLTMSDNSEPHAPISSAWEVPCTLSSHPGHTWGYKSWVETPPMEKEVRRRVQQLGRIASRGGNYLLNIGPKPDGTIQPWQAEVLQGIGKWVEQNKKAIFGTHPTPFILSHWGEATWKDNKLYLQITHWPDDGKLVIPNLVSDVKKVSLLKDDSQTYSFEKNGDILTVAVPEKTPDPNLPILTVECDGEPETSIPTAQPMNGITLDRKTQISKNFYHGLGYRNGIGQVKKTWYFEAKESGKYKINIDYNIWKKADPENPYSVVLTIAGKELHFKLPISRKRKSINLGKVFIEKGRHKLVFTKDVEPTLEEAKHHNTGSLTLRPIQINSITLRKHPILSADTAIIKGDTLKLEHTRNGSNLGWWRNPNDYAVWKLDIDQSGIYKINGEFATSDATEMILHAAGQQCRFHITATEGWNDFQKTSAEGTLKLEKDENIILSLKPTDKDNWKAVNVRSLQLVRQ